MCYSSSFIAASSSCITAAPIESRGSVVDFDAPTDGDVTILNYALTLKYLERKFYQECIEKFSKKDFVAAGFSDSFYQNLLEIYNNEKTRVNFIADALTAGSHTLVHEAKDYFPIPDVNPSFRSSSVLEGVGVSTYLGGEATIVNKGYLTATESIFTVESRHSSCIRAALGQSLFPKPLILLLNSTSNIPLLRNSLWDSHPETALCLSRHSCL